MMDDGGDGMGWNKDSGIRAHGMLGSDDYDNREFIAMVLVHVGYGLDIGQSAKIDSCCMEDRR